MSSSWRKRRAAMSPEASARANRDDALADASGDIQSMNHPDYDGDESSFGRGRKYFID